MNTATFKDMFSEFSEVSDGKIDLFLNAAALSVSEEKWGTLYDLGHGYLTAHMLTVASGQSSGASGPVTSERVGDLSRSYGSLKLGNFDHELQLTKYGVEFLRLRRQLVLTPFLTC